ncbi:hypothetical protein C8F04DRAFT_1095328 [Mycena alexandri]|uniref:Uncharacterized protein n=1 Tax=Mycena alexandri TaxID=1745969 RepID=A0AAD6X2C3_9AGAR|nr:hypothetical protein C8F04DRAFT_1095328 [Mycena alexandri]
MCSNAQGINPRDTMSECDGDFCDGAHSHSRSQTSGGPAPTRSSATLKGGSSPKQATVIALAVVLSLVVLGAIVFVIWWKCVRRRRRGYAGTQPYIDTDPHPAPTADHGGITIDAAPPYVLPAVDPFPLMKAPRTADLHAEGGNRVQNIAEKRASVMGPPSYPSMETGPR